MSEKDPNPLIDVSPQMKKALTNPDIPHIRFNSLSIEPRTRLVLGDVEEDYILMLLRDDKVVATLEVNMEDLENILELYRKKGLGNLN